MSDRLTEVIKHVFTEATPDRISFVASRNGWIEVSCMVDWETNTRLGVMGSPGADGTALLERDTGDMGAVSKKCKLTKEEMAELHPFFAKIREERKRLANARERRAFIDELQKLTDSSW